MKFRRVKVPFWSEIILDEQELNENFSMIPEDEPNLHEEPKKIMDDPGIFTEVSEEIAEEPDKLTEEAESEPEPEEQELPPYTFAQTLEPEIPQMLCYAVPAPSQKKRKKKKKARRGLAAPWVILLSLLCALLGGLLGGRMVAGRMKTEVAAPVVDESLSRRVEALENAAQQNIRREEYTSQENIATTAVYEQNVPAVVGITTGGIKTNAFGQSTNFASCGSGFIVRADGYVLTNCHVVEGAKTLNVTLNNGEEYTAEVIGSDADFDVAVLKIDAENLPTVKLGDSDLLRVGDQVAAIGNPLGELTLSMTVGYISALDREINTDGTPINMLQTDVAINSGNSGGPLFDMKGNVIGITTAKYSGATSSGATIEGIGFALPINDVMLIADDLIELGYISGRAYLGITGMEMDENTAKRYSLPIGVYVSSVTASSCAAKAGVLKGDIILALGDHETPSYSALRRALLACEPGDETTISIYRAGTELTLNVVLDERPSDEEIDAIEKAANENNTEEQKQPPAEVPEQETKPTPDENYSGGYSGGFPMPDGFFEDWFSKFFGE